MKRKRVVISVAGSKSDGPQMVEGLDLLNLARIEEGRYLYKPVSTDIEELIRAVLVNIKQKIALRKLRVTLQSAKQKLPKVFVDASLIEMVIQNILENSIQYTKQHGTIRISTTLKEKEIEVSVQDNGIGIPDNVKERIFTKFFRGREATSMETVGSGLGLFMAKNIVETHGGKIWFSSTEGKGTTFYFTIPLKSKMENRKHKKPLS